MYEICPKASATPEFFFSFFAYFLFCIHNHNLVLDVLRVSDVQVFILEQHWWCEPCSWGRGLKFVLMASESFVCPGKPIIS
jgi:hypothetical protein